MEREREVTIKTTVQDWDTTFGNRKTIITAEVANELLQPLTPKVLQAALEEIGHRLTEKWLETHGQEVLDQLAPGVIAEAIKVKVTEHVYKSMGITTGPTLDKLAQRTLEEM